MQCPFCNLNIADDATVCPACQRDTVVPPTLLKERDELIRKRDRLIEDLNKAKIELKACKMFGRLRFGRAC